MFNLHEILENIYLLMMKMLENRGKNFKLNIEKNQKNKQQKKNYITKKKNYN